MKESTAILKFPKPLEASAAGASRWQKLRTRAILFLGRLLTWLRLPGTIRDVQFTDEVSGQQVTVKVGPLGTRLTINGRDYYLSRFTGKLVGAGYGCPGS